MWLAFIVDNHPLDNFVCDGHNDFDNNKARAIIIQQQSKSQTLDICFSLIKNIIAAVIDSLFNCIMNSAPGSQLLLDGHIHIEGVDCSEPHNYALLRRAIKFIAASPAARNGFERVLHQDFETLQRKVLDSLVIKKKNISFERFLQHLYANKFILASEYELIASYLKYNLQKLLSNGKSARIGLTPLIFAEFGHLDQDQWLRVFQTHIRQVLVANPSSQLTLVLETKRKHLVERIDNRPVFDLNLEIFSQLIDQLKRLPNIKFSLSICDDAARWPLLDRKILDGFNSYISFIRQFPSVSFSAHVLEVLPDSESVDSSVQDHLKTQSALELPVLFECLEKHSIYRVNLIHMCNTFANANIDPDSRTEQELKDIALGEAYLDRLSARGDRIIYCFSSNKTLGNPFLLDYPEILVRLLDGGLNIILGTDDPGPFGVQDIGQELEIVCAHLEEVYADGFRWKHYELNAREVSQLVKKKLIRNSTLVFE